MLNAEVPAGRVLVAVSGGPDSTALMLALHDAGRDIVAAHYDHALREGSEVVAARVAEMCEALGVRLVGGRRAEALAGGSLQAAARALRYGFLERARIEASADVVALGHTADDVVEGVVMHLLRGCGLAGLRGMPARRGAYVRPFLRVWRRDIDAFLRERGVAACEDPANSDPRFMRVRVRRDVLPALERDRPGITRRFHAVAMAATVAHRAALEAAVGRPTDEALLAMPEPVAAEALTSLYVAAGGPSPGLARSHIASMLALARPGRGGRGVDLPGGLRFRIVGGLMQVVPAVSAPAREARLAVSTCAGCADPGAVHLRAGLDLRVAHRSPGLRMRPAGGRGTRKLQDLFVDARVPREERDRWPLVFAGDQLAWVPGIAVHEDFATRRGEPAQHVVLSPMPVAPASKVARLETPRAPSASGAQELGDLS